MKTNNQLKIATYGKFDFNKLSNDQQELFCTILLPHILELHNKKTKKLNKDQKKWKQQLFTQDTLVKDKPSNP